MTDRLTSGAPALPERIPRFASSYEERTLHVYGFGIIFNFLSSVLAHAALVMILMFYNSASPETSQCTMNNFCMVDVRPRLKAPYASRHGYPGYLRHPFYAPPSNTGTPLPLDRPVLVKTMEAIQVICGSEADGRHVYCAGCGNVSAWNEAGVYRESDPSQPDF
ncbi:hypothetical protein C8R44DRAFT_735698 [Mycena epipterygia]|nr:hypothetical protein C8R44DRAFT_735698 [Mycena epipterygia]